MTRDLAGILGGVLFIVILFVLMKVFDAIVLRKQEPFTRGVRPVVDPPPSIVTPQNLDAVIAAQKQDDFEKWAATADREVVLVVRYYLANGIETDWLAAAERAGWEKAHPEALETRIRQTRAAWLATNTDGLCILKKQSPASAKGHPAEGEVDK